MWMKLRTIQLSSSPLIRPRMSSGIRAGTRVMAHPPRPVAPPGGRRGPALYAPRCHAVWGQAVHSAYLFGLRDHAPPEAQPAFAPQRPVGGQVGVVPWAEARRADEDAVRAAGLPVDFRDGGFPRLLQSLLGDVAYDSQRRRSRLADRGMDTRSSLWWLQAPCLQELRERQRGILHTIAAISPDCQALRDR